METKTLDLPERFHDRVFAERLIDRLPAPRRPAVRARAHETWIAALCALPVSLALLFVAVELFAPAAPI
jgi:hypothetical protein